MKILWIVNTIFPYPNKELGNSNSPFGGWLIGLLNNIKNNKDIKLAIATTYRGNELKRYNDGTCIYYLLPCKNNLKYNKSLEKYWKKINEEFKPELVHIHGTEYAHPLSFQRACPKTKNIVSIQGLVSIISNYYLANMKYEDIIKNITYRDIIKRDNIIKEQRKFYKRGNNEIQIIKNSDAIIGRTTWDYANTYAIANQEKYYYCNETLRDVFYDSNWNINKIEKKSILVSQAGYPIKGFHILLEAVNILVKKYPDIKVYVAGPNIIDTSSFYKKNKIGSYGKFIKRKINAYKLNNNIVFLGLLNDEQMLNRMIHSNVYVQASSIENSSNALGEAMLIGMPCVASYVGGTPDMIKDREEGLLYPFGDYGVLAYYISRVFDNDELALKLGKNAQKHAKIVHDRTINAEKMIEIYKKIIEGGDNI